MFKDSLCGEMKALQGYWFKASTSPKLTTTQAFTNARSPATSSVIAGMDTPQYGETLRDT